MIPASRLAAARRTLSHFYWARIRKSRANICLPGAETRDLSVSARNGVIEVSGTAQSALRFVSDRSSSLAFPDSRGHFAIRLDGTRHLAVASPPGSEAIPLHVYSSLDRLSAGLRCTAELIAFPFRHGRDITGYFLRGDSASGDRLERALLPNLAPAGRVPIPCGQPGFGGAEAAETAPVTPAAEPVDIILPVYNATALVRECLDNLGRHTSASHRVIIIDDASPDPEIRPLLTGWAARHPGTMLLVNDENLGFVGTVNRGLAAAQGDVVLLNSDAMVPPGWLERLMAPIRDDESVASVTPLSNDAEIFAVPVECRPRVLSPGEALAADRLAATLNGQEARATAPTGVGFCMALSRRWLGQVPALDTIFGRGYGEEVDWCRRTAALGGTHLGIGNLFVEHRSGSSFGDEKPERLKANNRIVAERYPSYDLMVQEFRDADPLAGPRIAVGLAMLAGRTDMAREAFPVYLAHRLGGGSEMWLREQITADIAARNGALVLRDAIGEPGVLPGEVIAELHAAEGITRVRLGAGDVGHLLRIPARVALVYSCLVSARDPIGLMTMVLDARPRAEHPDDSFTLLFHDYLPLCPSYTLIGSNGRYCGLPEGAACQKCYAALPVTSGQRPPMIAAWRESWKSIAGQADRIEVFSEDSRRQIERVWPDLSDRICVAPHDPGHLPDPVAPGGSDALTVGVLGAIGHNKGAAILRDLAAQTGRHFRIVIIGKIDPAYASPRLLVHGPYDRAEIADLARHYRLDCWLIPSIWPETFSYAVHECLATGLPVYGFDIGAQGDALRAAPNGIVLPVAEPLSPSTFIGAAAFGGPQRPDDAAKTAEG